MLSAEDFLTWIAGLEAHSPVDSSCTFFDIMGLGLLAGSLASFGGDLLSRTVGSVVVPNLSHLSLSPRTPPSVLEASSFATVIASWLRSIVIGRPVLKLETADLFLSTGGASVSVSIESPWAAAALALSLLVVHTELGIRDGGRRVYFFGKPKPVVGRGKFGVPG